MKTKRDFIYEIKVNEANFKYCAETGIINGTLLIDIENAMQKYTDQQLLLHGVVFNEAENCAKCLKPKQMKPNTIQMLCECVNSENKIN